MNHNHLDIQQNRCDLIRLMVEVCMKSIYDRNTLTESEVNHLLSESVRNKLLNPEESYQLRDILLSGQTLEAFVDKRIAYHTSQLQAA